MRRGISVLVLLMLCAAAGGGGSSAPLKKAQSAKPRAAPPPGQKSYYANTPRDIIPYRRMMRPYQDNFYAQPQQWLGAGREKPEPKVKTVKIGFLGPAQDGGPLAMFGKHMLQGARLAIERANAAGGYRGLPFELVVHEDKARWGDSSNSIVKMYGDEKVWGVLGSMDSANSHVMMRLTLKLPLPIVNTATSDQTLMEHRVPFILRLLPDDRQYSYVTAWHLFKEKNYRYVALFRINNRDGRFAVKKLTDAARRMGRPFVVDQRFADGDKDFAAQLQRIRNTPAEAVVVWGNPRETALIVKQMRKMGMKQPVIGWFRAVSPVLLETAGRDAEGIVCPYPFDPTANDAMLKNFQRAYKQRFGSEPEVFASYAYDGTNLLIAAIRKVGLNRVRIADALGEFQTYRGVTGRMIFDGARNNVCPIYLAEVKDGRFHFRRATFSEGQQKTARNILPRFKSRAVVTKSACADYGLPPCCQG